MSKRVDELSVLARAALLDPCLRLEFVKSTTGHTAVLAACFTVQLPLPEDMPLDLCRQRLREAYVTLANQTRLHLQLHLHAVGPVQVQGEPEYELHERQGKP